MASKNKSSKSKGAPADVVEAAPVEDQSTPITDENAGAVVDANGVEHVGVIPFEGPWQLLRFAKDDDEARGTQAVDEAGEPIQFDTREAAEAWAAERSADENEAWSYTVDEGGAGEQVDADDDLMPDADNADNPDRIALEQDLEDASEDVPLFDESKIPTGDDRSTINEARQAQFPTLDGHPEVEIAERSADVHTRSSDRHVKAYRLLREQYDRVADEFDHGPNYGATRQYMLDNGLRPVGDVEFVGSKNLPDGKTVELTYEVDAIPAVIASAPIVKNMQVPQVESSTSD